MTSIPEVPGASAVCLYREETSVGIDHDFYKKIEASDQETVIFARKAATD